MAHRPTSGRIALDYLTDLAVLVGLVVIAGWLIQLSLNDARLHDAVIGQEAIFIAIDRFTPQHLFTSYVQTINQMARGLGEGVDVANGIGSSVSQALSLVWRAAAAIIMAAPRTMLDLYRESTGFAAWIVLAGFVITLCIVFVWLIVAGRITLFRVVLASALSPLVVSVVFLLLQVFMIAMFDAFFWLTVLAPYAVACPVICTAYWLLFPHAQRGMTHSVLRAIGGALHPRSS